MKFDKPHLGVGAGLKIKNQRNLEEKGEKRKNEKTKKYLTNQHLNHIHKFKYGFTRHAWITFDFNFG